MKDHGVIVLTLFVLSLVIIGSSSALNENLTLGQYSISFNAGDQAPLIKTCKEPTRSTTADGINITNYQCSLINSTGRLLALSIGQYDIDRASVLAFHASDNDTKLWLEGWTWKTQTNTTFSPSVRGWSASSWLNNKAVLIIDGTYPEKELKRIRETLSVKENGEEIYKVRQ